MLNTFVSHDLVFEEKNEPFLFENASNLTHEFLFDALSKRNGSYFPQKRGAEKLNC